MMIRIHLSTVLWGLLIVAVDLNVGAFDVLFDPIGLAIVAGALIALGRIERSFSFAVPFAFCAIPVSLIQLAFPSGFFGFAGIVLYFFLIWFVCTGVMRLALSRGNVPLSVDATRQRTLNVAASGVALLTPLIAQLFGLVLAPLVVTAAIFGFAVLALTLLMLRQASRELAS